MTDGRPDLAVAKGHGISVLLNRGQRTFGPRVVIVSRERVISIAKGEVNGDGREDLIAQTVYGSPHAPLLVLLNRG